jgi:cysteine desulfurase
MAILGVARKLKSYGNHIITSNIEHSAVRNTIRHLKEEGFEISEIPVDNQGVLHVEDVEKAIRPTTILVSVMFANNEIGTIQPIQELAELTNRKNIILHTDAVQAIGKIRINLQEIKIDLLSATAHKIYGPKGIGLLFFRNAGNHLKFGRFIEPIIYGGGHEQGYRPSTENVPGIVGFAKAIELADKDLESEMARETQLRDEFIHWALNNIPESFLNGHPKIRLANNINLGFRFVEGESLILSLDEKGIAVSTGSACSSHSSEPSHVLQALNLKKEDMHGSVRITLGRSTTPEELDYVKIQLKEVVATLRKYSPLTPESLKKCLI